MYCPDCGELVQNCSCEFPHPMSPLACHEDGVDQVNWDDDLKDVLTDPDLAPALSRDLV